MRKTFFLIGVSFIVFSFLFVGLSSCKKDNENGGDDGGGGGGGGTSCPSGMISCGNTGKCCSSSYPYHGSNGKCYTTMANCKQKASVCTQCGSGGGGGGGQTCSPGYCLGSYYGHYFCCPKDYPHYAAICYGGSLDGKRCFASTNDIKKICTSGYEAVKCSKCF